MKGRDKYSYYSEYETHENAREMNQEIWAKVNEKCEIDPNQDGNL